MSDNSDWKTIRVPKDVYDDAKERKEEHGVTWGEYVNPHAWHSVFDEPTDAPTGNAEARTADIDTDASNLTYDDVVQATRKALRDELPDQVFR